MTTLRMLGLREGRAGDEVQSAQCESHVEVVYRMERSCFSYSSHCERSLSKVKIRQESRGNLCLMSDL